MEFKYQVMLITTDHKHIICMGATNELDKAEKRQQDTLQWLKGFKKINPKFARSIVIVQAAPDNSVYVVNKDYLIK